MILLSSLFQQGKANPGNEGAHVCHSVGPYTIASANSTNLQATTGSTFNINITAFGPSMSVKLYSAARDNSKFPVTPADTITDNSPNDQNATTGGISVLFTFTAPSADGSYKILILALDPTQPQPDFAYLEFTVTVGAGGINLNIFSHLSIYIGLAAVLCLGIGTILYEKNNQLTKAHGILAGVAFILTTINIIFVIPMTSSVVGSWIGGGEIDWMHFIHIAFGIIGYGAGAIAIFTGISGIRTKKAGYVALIFWSFNLISGLITWGVVF